MPSQPAVVSASTTTVSLSWGLARPTEIATYGLYDDGVYIGTSTSPSATFSSLSCSEHLFQVDAADRAGNRSSKRSIKAKPVGCEDPPAPAPDLVPPSVPQGMTFTATTQTSVSLAWTASTDNVGVAGYRLYRNGVSVGTTQGLSSVYGALTCGTSYTFALEAYDAAGNVSNRAEATGVTSTSPCDAPPPPPPPSPPGDEPAATLFVSRAGSDGYPCTRAAPCASFDRAYAQALPGEVVEVAGGTYPSQTIRAAGVRSAPNVVFRPASGARVILDGLKFGPNADPAFGPDYITVRGFETTYKTAEPGAGNQRGVFVGPGSTFIRLEDMDAGSVSTWFADQVTVKGGDFGPCHVIAGSSNVCGQNMLDVSTNVTVDGARFHDYRFDETCFTVSGADCHYECLYLNGGENNTIKNSTFSGCAIFDIFATISGADAGRIGHKNLLIENNWFAAPWTESLSGGSPSRGTAVWLAWCQNSSLGYRNVLIRFNSFQANTTVGPNSNPPCVFDNVRVTANVLMHDGCESSWTYAYNVWTTAWRTGSCASSDRILGTTIPYVNGGSGSGFDYHIAATSSIDDLVPAAAGCPATDIDGEARPAGAWCDAGSDERP
jgi:chitodextrinase